MKREAGLNGLNLINFYMRLLLSHRVSFTSIINELYSNKTNLIVTPRIIQRAGSLRDVIRYTFEYIHY